MKTALPTKPVSTHSFHGDSDPVDQENWLAAAERIGAKLCRDAIWSGKQCNWMGWGMEPSNGTFSPAYRSCHSNLYDGVAGVALFLAQLQQFTNDRYTKITAEGAISRVIEDCQECDPSIFVGLVSRARWAWRTRFFESVNCWDDRSGSKPAWTVPKLRHKRQASRL